MQGKSHLEEKKCIWNRMPKQPHTRVDKHNIFFPETNCNFDKSLLQAENRIFSAVLGAGLRDATALPPQSLI